MQRAITACAFNKYLRIGQLLNAIHSYRNITFDQS